MSSTQEKKLRKLTFFMRDGTIITSPSAELSDAEVEKSRFLDVKWLGVGEPGGKVCIQLEHVLYVKIENAT